MSDVVWNSLYIVAIGYCLLSAFFIAMMPRR